MDAVCEVIDCGCKPQLVCVCVRSGHPALVSVVFTTIKHGCSMAVRKTLQQGLVFSLQHGPMEASSGTALLPLCCQQHTKHVNICLQGSTAVAALLDPRRQGM